MSQRFSDAELAAEYWYNEWLYERLKFTGDPEVVQCDRQSETLHRFATLPHAHEPNLVPEDTKENR